ncbi:MAG: Rieske 2Fe-2S domain-containing protein [Chloroflexi bacterium]|nr:Rieske 2Fe-2S domain-containing protein [Chloroflexota bacterium]
MAETKAQETGIFSRREFLRWGFWAATALATAEIGGAMLVFFWPKLKAGAFGGEVNIGTLDEILGQLPVNAVPLYFRDARFYLSHIEDGLLAMYRKCPHLGCVVPWNFEEDQFHCPCHSSLYNRKGEVLGGPAPRPLDLMAIEIRGSEIWVNTGEITQRSAYDPSQATSV